MDKKTIRNKVLVLFYLISFLFLNVVFADDSLSINSPNYFEEQTNIYEKIHYLGDEYLSFDFCTEAESRDMSFKLICDGGEEVLLDVIQESSSDGCYFTNYNLIDYACDDFDLEISYNLNNVEKKIKRSFTKQKQSLLINHVLRENVPYLDDEELSYYLIVLNDIQDQNMPENVEIYDLLKNNRDNSQKCWPSSDCEIGTTATILRNLIFAEYDLASRMLDDGKYYLEKETIISDKSIDKFRYEVYFEFDDSIDNDCEFFVDDSSGTNYDYLEDGNDTIVRFNGLVEENLEFACEEDLDDLEIKIYDELLYEENYNFLNPGGEFELLIEDINDDYGEDEIFLFKIEILEFNVDEDDISCSLEIDGDLKNYNFEEGDSFKNLIIEKDVQEKIVFNCDEVVDKINLKVYHKELLDENYVREFKIGDLEKRFSTFTCIGDGGVCDYYISLDTLLSYSNIEEKEKLDEYIDNFVVGDSTDKENYVFFENEILDTSKYLYYNSDEKLIDYLKYNQNNDGSWGDGKITNKLIETTWAVLGLQKSIPDSEYIDDAEKWIYYNEPIDGWGTIEKNTLAYLAIKKKLKPYVKFSTLNIMESKSTFTLENPTIYELKNLEISFTGGVEDYLSYLETLGDFDESGLINFTIEVDESFYGTLSGELEITGIDGKNQLISLIKIPIAISGSTPIKYTEGDVIGLFEGNDIINLELDIINSEFKSTCSYLNPISNSNEDIEISSNNNILSFSNPELIAGNFTIELNCEDNSSNKITLPIEFTIAVVEKKMELLTNEVIISENSDFLITIKNTLNDKQTFEFAVEGDFEGVVEPVEINKILAKNETRDVYFKFVDETAFSRLGNNSNGFLTITSQNGYVGQIPISYSSIVVAQDSGMPWYYFLFGFIAFVMIIIVIRRYRLQQLELENNAVQNQVAGDGDMHLDESELDFE